MADEGRHGLLLCRLLGRALPVACPLSSAGSPCWGLVGLSQCVSVRPRGLPLSRAMADLLYCWRHHKEMGLSRAVHRGLGCPACRVRELLHSESPNYRSVSRPSCSCRSGTHVWEGIGCRAGSTVGAPRAARCGATSLGSWSGRRSLGEQVAGLQKQGPSGAVAVPGEAGPELGHLCRGTAGPEQGAAVRQGGNGRSLGARGHRLKHPQRHGATLPYFRGLGVCKEAPRGVCAIQLALVQLCMLQ